MYLKIQMYFPFPLTSQHVKEFVFSADMAMNHQCQALGHIAVMAFTLHTLPLFLTPTQTHSRTYTRMHASTHAQTHARTHIHSLKICQFLLRDHVTSSSVEWMEMALHVSLRLQISA